VAKTQIRTLLISGANNKQVNPDRVRELYADLASAKADLGSAKADLGSAKADLGSPKKVFVDLACSSHNAMWEKTTYCCSRHRSNG
jgi:hypothetical protein